MAPKIEPSPTRDAASRLSWPNPVPDAMSGDTSTGRYDGAKTVTGGTDHRQRRCQEADQITE
jgi:hypothetical protein